MTEAAHENPNPPAASTPAKSADTTAPKTKISPAPAAKPRQTVIVACKIPTGLELQLCVSREFWEDTPTGAKKREKFVRTGKTVLIEGCGYPSGTPPKGYPERPHMVGGYALTYGVDKEFWDAWLKQNVESSFVISGQIFAHGQPESIRSNAKENKDVRSGLEPLQPDNDPRMPKAMNSNITKVETADEMKERESFQAAVG